MELFVTRHGQTDYNLAEQISGIAPAVLTDLGRAQAEALAEKLRLNQSEYNIRHIITSPLRRALETASFCEKALELKAVVDERVREMNFGVFEGKNCHDPEFQRILSSPFERFENGESIVDVAARAYSFLKGLKETTGGENALLVCHGMFARVLQTYFGTYSVAEMRSLGWANCEVKRFEL
jgi:Fructose-2,6-bisphosphatase